MLKVFLVEDEFVVREGIRNNIDWGREGFSFCGDASDGELAYPLIQREQPDIVITDIRMPFMNGLELSRLVKKELPFSKIIILSGHEEFGYAQEAIKIGVTEYLLKPISGPDLVKAVKRVGQQLLRERQERENLERYRREMEENETDLKRKFFNELIGGSLSSAAVLEKGRDLGLELGAKFYQIILFKYQPGSGEEPSVGELPALAGEFRQVGPKYPAVLTFDRDIEGTALLVKGESQEQLDTLRNEYLEELKTLFARYPMVRYFGGVGMPVGRLAHLPESFEKASRAFSYRFILDKSAVISCNEPSAQLAFESSDSSLGTLELGGLDLKKAETFLKNGDAGEVSFFIDEFLNSIGSASEKSFLFKQYILINLYVTVLTFLREIGCSEVSVEEPFTGPDGMKEMFNDPQKARDYLTRIFSAAVAKRDSLRSVGYHRMIEQAKEFIHEHYSDENISLNDTAAFVNISPNYFSAVFSRETGKSFIRYLTDLRMNRAKELLKCTDLRCSDISMAVGYKDPHYFSYLFKKIHNCSPVQYRAAKN